MINDTINGAINDTINGNAEDKGSGSKKRWKMARHNILKHFADIEIIKKELSLYKNLYAFV